MDREVLFSVHQNRKPFSSRRRTRSTGSLPWGQFSGDSSSSVGEWDISRELGMSSIQQSDSDDISGAQNKRGPFNLQPNRLRRLFHSIESDSVNENFSPSRPATRRKRKLKRMAVDGEMSTTSIASSSRLTHSCQSSYAFGSKKKRIIRHGSNCENRFCIGGSSGKRKRSSLHDPPRTVLALHRLSLNDSHIAHSSSSISSSDSDPGIYTDEGREGDDEQSDWVYEASDRGAEGGDQRGIYLSTRSSHSSSQHHKFKSFLSIISNHREFKGGRRRVHSDKVELSAIKNDLRSSVIKDLHKSKVSSPNAGQPPVLTPCGSSTVDPKRRRYAPLGTEAADSKSRDTEPMDEGDPSAT